MGFDEHARKIVASSAGVEAVTGVVLIAAPATVVRLLWAAPLPGVGSAVARLTGCSLSALSLACWPQSATPNRASVRALLCYNALAATFFAYFGIRGQSVGPLLWPAAIVHAGFAVMLARITTIRNS